MHEYTWVPATTSYSDLSMPSAPSTLNRVDFADGRNDGIKRVLVGNQDGRIYDLTFQNGNWIQDLVVQSFGAVKGLAVGPGRNDGVNRIYASKGGSLKEYTYTPTTSAPFAAQLLPNGILEWSSNPGGVYDVEWSSDLTTWRSDWSLLTGIPATGATTQQPIPRFFRVKRRTE